MADNVVLDAGAGGATVAGAELSISGDTAIVQFVGCGVLAGSEGSWTFTHFVGGAGAVAAGVQRVTLAADDPAVVSVQLIDDAIVADDAAFTPATTKVMMAGFEFDDTTPDSVNEGDAGAARMSANRNIYMTIRDAAGNERGVNVNASNQMSVSVDNTVTVASHAVTNAGTFAVQAVCTNAGTFAVQAVCTNAGTFAVQSGAERAEDAAHSTGHTGNFVLTVRSDTAASTAGTDGDYAAFTTDSTGRLHCNVSNTLTVASHAVTNAGTFAVQAAQSGTWTVDLGATDNAVLDAIAASVAGTLTVGSHAVTNAGTFAVQAGSERAEDAAHSTGHTGSFVLTVRSDTAASTAGTDGDYAAFTTDSTGRLHCNVSNTLTVASHAVTNAGTFAVQAASAGDVAHDSADSGNPIKVGAKAETSPKGITLVADADRTDLLADADGILMVKLNTSGADAISEAVSNTDGASTAFSNFGAVASTKNAVTCITVFRTDTATTMAYVDFRDGTAGAVLFRVPLPPAGGAVISLAGQPIFKTSANTALAFDVSSALTTVYISISGFQTKV